MCSDPFVIHLNWLSIIPQISLDVPRDVDYERYPPEFGYLSVQLLIAEFPLQEKNFIESECSSANVITHKPVDELIEFELMQLLGKSYAIYFYGNPSIKEW